MSFDCHSWAAQERMKALALGEEVEKPMNVHRWRHLEGADPAAHELLLQTQALQRRLIAMTEVRHLADVAHASPERAPTCALELEQGGAANEGMKTLAYVC